MGTQWLSYILVVISLVLGVVTWVITNEQSKDAFLDLRKCEFNSARSQAMWAAERTQLADELRKMNSQIVAMKFKEAHDEQRNLLLSSIIPSSYFNCIRFP